MSLLEMTTLTVARSRRRRWCSRGRGLGRSSRSGRLLGSGRSSGLLRNGGTRRLCRVRRSRGLLGSSRSRGLRRRGRLWRVAPRWDRVARQPRLVPRPATVTGRGSLLLRWSMGSAASLASVPTPAVCGALSVLRGSWWAGGRTTRDAAITLREATIKIQSTIARGIFQRYVLELVGFTALAPGG